MEELMLQLEMLQRYSEYYQKRWCDWDDLRCRMAYMSRALLTFYESKGLGIGDILNDSVPGDKRDRDDYFADKKVFIV